MLRTLIRRLRKTPAMTDQLVSPAIEKHRQLYAWIHKSLSDLSLMAADPHTPLLAQFSEMVPPCFNGQPEAGTWADWQYVADCARELLPGVWVIDDSDAFMANAYAEDITDGLPMLCIDIRDSKRHAGRQEASFALRMPAGMSLHMTEQ